MNPAANQSRQTVLVAADVSGFSGSTLALAVHMAAALKARLQGLFIEDEDLLQVTALPISREISLATARQRSTDVDSMRRALRALAAEFESSLQREARALQVGYNFDYVRGRMHDIGLHATADTHFTILERKRPVLHGRSAATPDRVLWITHDPERELPALRALLNHSPRRGLELVVVGDAPEPGLVAALRSLHDDRDGGIALQRWGTAHLLEQLAQGIVFDFAVLSRPAASDNLAAILKATTCPVILVT